MKILAKSNDLNVFDVYRSNTSPLSSYYSINKNADLGIHCGSKLSAYVVATSYSQTKSFIDKLKICPRNILDSDDCTGYWSQLHSIYSMKLPNDVKTSLITSLRDSENVGMELRDALLNLGYDCIRYKNSIEDTGDYSYIILETNIIRKVNNNELVTFRELFPKFVKHVRLSDLKPSDKILMTNGMYDVGIAKFIDYTYDSANDVYEINGEIIRNLSFTYKFKSGSITSMYRGNDYIEIVTSIPSILSDM